MVFGLFELPPLSTVHGQLKSAIFFVWVTTIIHRPCTFTRWYFAFQRYYHYSLSMHNEVVVFCLFWITLVFNVHAQLKSYFVCLNYHNYILSTQNENMIFILFGRTPLFSVQAQLKDDILFVWVTIIIHYLCTNKNWHFICLS